MKRLRNQIKQHFQLLVQVYLLGKQLGIANNPPAEQTWKLLVILTEYLFFGVVL